MTSSDRSPPVVGVSAPLSPDRTRRLADVERSALRPAERPDVAIAELPLAVTLALFMLVFLLPAWPWLSGAVTIPWDAKSQFLPPLQFLSTSLATDQSPFWTPNVYAGWPLISDPQSLIFSPLHFLLAYFDRMPSFRAVDGVTFTYLFLGGVGIILYFHDRAWHPAGALVAALTFAFAGSASSRLQHTSLIIDLAYFALTLWVLRRALQQSSSWTGAAAGVVVGLLAVGRDHVALISLYTVIGFIVAHWVESKDRLNAVRARIRPLAAVFGVAALIAVVPVTMTVLLAARSNRPEIAWAVAGVGSLHPAHLLTLAFPNLYRAMNPSDLDYWGPGTLRWQAALGGAEVDLAKSMGLFYLGALPLVVTVSFGVMRGLAWSRDIRFFSIAAGGVLLYALGWYTPAFHVMYKLLPGVDLFRRPADATFVLGALLAIIAGYLVHCWLQGLVPRPNWMRRTAERVIPIVLIATVFALAHRVVTTGLAIVPVVSAISLTAGAGRGAFLRASAECPVASRRHAVADGFRRR